MNSPPLEGWINFQGKFRRGGLKIKSLQIKQSAMVINLP